jgi:hypothetical protein
LMSIGREISSMISSASLSARLKAEMMITGWMLRSSWGSACARISPAIHTHQNPDGKQYPAGVSTHPE